ncbi:MAG: putative signal peptide protein [Betaproteobacteria bacterium]|nr:putative signal peptide protein [Betaproteobacteria bacterium]
MRAWLLPAAVACAACMQANFVWTADTSAAEALRARFAVLAPKIAGSQFQRPLHLESVESSNSVRGDVFAQVDYPFAEVDQVFNGPARWCDVLILHINTKFCGVSNAPSGPVLTVNIGKKVEERLADTSRVEFNYRVAAATADYLAVELRAGKGPLSTSDFRILLESTPIDKARSIIHLTYSYSFGATSRLATQVYLASAGRSKVGFTTTGNRADGEPDYIGGMRGIVERNTMRYFLAIDAYLGALGAPPAARVEQSFQRWYDATEKYPRQLHEVERTAYLEMKRREYRRQQEQSRLSSIQ